MIERYQSYIGSGGNPENPPQLLDVEPVDNFKDQLEEKAKLVNKFKKSISRASAVLQQALQLKANAGGAIKREIEKALGLLN